MKSVLFPSSAGKRVISKEGSLNLKLLVSVLVEVFLSRGSDKVLEVAE